MKNLFSGISNSTPSSQERPSLNLTNWRSLVRWGIFGVAIVIIIGWISQQSWFPVQINLKGGEGQADSTVTRDNQISGAVASVYSAIYLSSNQVYFGVLKDNQEEYLTLTDVFYFRQGTAPTDGDVRLIKLGNELHGPEDKIFFNRDHVILTERMKEDSEIVKAILKYKAQEENQ